MDIKELTEYSTEASALVAALVGELSDRCAYTDEKLKATIEDAGCHLFCVYDRSSIVGCATLCIFHSPTGTKASVEDVVVSSRYRGRHLGRQLMEYVLQQARQYAPIEMHLTSNPGRVAANGLYRSLGFEKKETNCYTLMIV